MYRHALYDYDDLRDTTAQEGKILRNKPMEEIVKPVRYEGPVKTVDFTFHDQALQFSPDGVYAGPITCAACHTVNGNGVPVLLEGTDYFSDYWASVTPIHFMREKDRSLTVKELIEKYPYAKSIQIVTTGWR